jgi:hypothetical protein
VDGHTFMYMIHDRPEKALRTEEAIWDTQNVFVALWVNSLHQSICISSL